MTRLPAALGRMMLAMLLLLVPGGCAAPQLLETGPLDRRAELRDSHFTARDGERLAVSRWQASRPTAIFVAVHGFNEYAETFRLPAPWFAERGVSVIGYDQRGFGRTAPSKRGRWAGGDVMARDLVDFVAEVRNANPGLPVYVMGTSMGGAVTMHAAANHGLAADGLILVAPAIWGWRSMNPILKSALWVTAHTVPDSSATGSQLEIWPSDNIEWLRAYSRDSYNIKQSRFDTLYGLVTLMDEAAAAAPRLNLPVLYLYGEKDQVVPDAPTRTVIATLAQPHHVHIYPQGYHMLLHDTQRLKVFRDIMGWINSAPEAMPVAGRP